MCMGDWKDHGSSTGGYYKCNKYEDMKNSDKNFNDAEAERESAKHELERYMFYFERYNNHNKAETIGKKTVPKIMHRIE